MHFPAFWCISGTKIKGFKRLYFCLELAEIRLHPRQRNRDVSQSEQGIISNSFLQKFKILTTLINWFLIIFVHSGLIFKMFPVFVWTHLILIHLFSLKYSLIDCLIDWLADWLTYDHWLMNLLNHWLVDCLNSLIGWLTISGSLTDLSTNWLSV